MRVSDALHSLIEMVAEMEGPLLLATIRGLILGDLTILRRIFEASPGDVHEGRSQERISLLREELKEVVRNAKERIVSHKASFSRPSYKKHPGGRKIRWRPKKKQPLIKHRKPKLKRYGKQIKVEVFDDNGRQIRKWANAEGRKVSDTIRKILYLVLLRGHLQHALLLEPEELEELVQEIEVEINKEEPKEESGMQIYSRLHKRKLGLKGKPS